MLSLLFPLAYAATLTYLVLQAFRMMRFSSLLVSDGSNRSQDRTGLKTVHPELLDKNGKVTDEKLLAVRFSDLEGFAPTDS